VVDEVERTLIHAPAEAAWVHCATLARVAGVAVKMGKAPCENSAVEVLVQLFRYELGKRPPAGIVGLLLLEGQQVLLQHLVKHSGLRAAGVNRPVQETQAMRGPLPPRGKRPASLAC
jgi:hypothetical protein